MDRHERGRAAGRGEPHTVVLTAGHIVFVAVDERGRPVPHGRVGLHSRAMIASQPPG